VGKDKQRGEVGVGSENQRDKMNTSVQIVDISILRHVPEMLAWLFGIVLAAIMIRRGGAKAEKLLLAGCILMFAVGVISMLLSGLMPWLREQSLSAQQLGLALSIQSIPGLAGFVCLVIAFWMRFRAGRRVSA
jgi:hypothetical protein